MLKMEKIKGIIYFENGKGQKVGIDLNQKCYIGVKGNPIQSTPVGIKNVMGAYYQEEYVQNDRLLKFICIKLMGYYGHTLNQLFNRFSSIIELYDKLNSVNFPYEARIVNTNVARFCLSNFNKFLEWAKEHNSGNGHDFYDEFRYLEWTQNANIANVSQYPVEFLRYLYNYWKDVVPSQYLNRVVWYIVKNRIYEIYQLEKKTQELYYSNLHECNTRILRNIINLSERMNLPNIPKGELNSIYIQLLDTYRVNKTKIDTEGLIKHQTNKGLEFELGDYIVVVPTTPEQFKDEADQQGNCVYRSYMHSVVKGETNVVFIRHKNNLEKSLITCEVQNGKIYQYLLQCNGYVRESQHPELYAFQKAYQEHLNNNYIK